MTAKVGRPVSKQCPSLSAYKRHKRSGDHCDDPEGCRDAYNAAHREYYAKRKGLTPSDP